MAHRPTDPSKGTPVTSKSSKTSEAAVAQTVAAIAATREAAKTVTADKVVIFDTTLRDGEQCPGATMTFEEKLEVADFLEEMGVDIIEAGFPIASDGDWEAVDAISREFPWISVAALARACALRRRNRRLRDCK